MTCSSKTREEYSVLLLRNVLTYDMCSVVHGIFYCFLTKIKNVMLSSHEVKFFYFTQHIAFSTHRCRDYYLQCTY